MSGKTKDVNLHIDCVVNLIDTGKSSRQFGNFCGWEKSEFFERAVFLLVENQNKSYKTYV